MARFVPDRNGIRYTFREKDGPVGRYAQGMGRTLTSLAKRQVGVRTRALQRSITYRVYNRRSSVNDLRIQVGSDNKIALLHHKGTKPHTIKPRYKKALRFQQHGKIVFAHIVKHPGTRANRYLTDNLPKVID